MAFQPETYYTLAQQLQQSAKGDDARRRSAISRAYYSALLVARDARNLTTLGTAGHQAVISAYRSNAADTVVADTLASLKLQREKADYRPTSTCTDGEALNALAQAKVVLRHLGKLPATP